MTNSDNDDDDDGGGRVGGGIPANCPYFDHNERGNEQFYHVSLFAKICL